MVGVSDISTTMSLKLKRSVVELVAYVFLVNFSTLVLELPITFNYQP